MSKSDSFVKFEKVDKSYDGEILVVKDLNLDVPKGEFLTMLGPSGSGKTTVLMMLAGFETPTSGEIYLDGNPISSIPPNKRRNRDGFSELRFISSYDCKRKFSVPS